MAATKAKRGTPAPAQAASEFVITREFDAPRDLVWKAWTEPERLAQWWGPKGCKIRVVKLDVKPGGIFHYVMQFNAGKEMWGRFVYREIAAPRRLAFVNSFSDPDGGITRAPFPKIGETWPLEVLNMLTLDDQGGKTTLTLRGSPINASAEEKQTFAAMFDSMRHGFGGTFDQLEAYLATARDSKPAGMEAQMQVEPQKGHIWLQRLVGEWTYEAECTAGPGQPSIKSEGCESVRSLGGLWIVAEGKGTMPDGKPATTLMTLGYDPKTQRYPGTWIGSMMTHMFAYDGEMDAAEKVLTLDTEGPSFTTEGKTAKFQDIIELRSNDHRVLTSRMLAEDGTWQHLVTAHYRRKT